MVQKKQIRTIYTYIFRDFVVVNQAILLVIKVGQDIMVINICGTFVEDRSKDVEVRAQTSNI